MNTLDLINAIRTGDSRKTQEAFESLTSERIETRIGELRTQVAQSMFAPVVEESLEIFESDIQELINEKDEGKRGLMFDKIAAKAAKEYGSVEAGKRVAGAIRKKILAKE